MRYLFSLRYIGQIQTQFLRQRSSIVCMFVEFRGKKVPVKISDPPLWEDVKNSDLITNWLNSLDESFDLQKIELQSVDKFSSGRIGFIKLKSTILRNGYEIPGIVLLRGAAVALLLDITDTSTNTKYTILERQPRVPLGTISTEIPAGMVDGNGNLRGVAIRELEEECGLVAKTEDLVDLTDLAYGKEHPGVYFSCGLCDEYLKLFYWKTRMSHDDIMRIEGRLGGKDQREQIVLKLVKMEDAPLICSDPKLLCALELVNNLKAAGKL